MRIKLTVVVAIALLVSSCAPSAPIPQTVIVLQTVEVTKESVAFVPVTVEVTVEVTRRVVVTATHTRTPANTLTPRQPSLTPSITPTPSKTPTITPTPNVAKTATAKAFTKLTEAIGDGFYLINVDIAPGIWRTTGNADNCYWKLTRRNGGIIDNHFGLAGGTIYIPSSAYQLQVQDCGRVEYISAP